MRLELHLARTCGKTVIQPPEPLAARIIAPPPYLKAAQEEPSLDRRAQRWSKLQDLEPNIHRAGWRWTFRLAPAKNTMTASAATPIAIFERRRAALSSEA